MRIRPKEYKDMSTKKLKRLYSKNNKKLNSLLEEKDILIDIYNDIESKIFACIMTDDCIEKELKRRDLRSIYEQENKKVYWK